MRGKLTPEQDARLCAEYGVTPGEWALRGTFNPCRFDIMSSERAGPPPDDHYIAIGSTASWLDTDPREEAAANARLMAASKPMLALLERARDTLDSAGLLQRDLAADIRALLDGLKGGSNEQD